jgi:hypothetical protein
LLILLGVYIIFSKPSNKVWDERETLFLGRIFYCYWNFLYTLSFRIIFYEWIWVYIFSFGIFYFIRFEINFQKKLRENFPDNINFLNFVFYNCEVFWRYMLSLWQLLQCSLQLGII